MAGAWLSVFLYVKIFKILNGTQSRHQNRAGAWKSESSWPRNSDCHQKNNQNRARIHLEDRLI
jgi:hypothetical protein